MPTTEPAFTLFLPRNVGLPRADEKVTSLFALPLLPSRDTLIVRSVWLNLSLYYSLFCIVAPFEVLRTHPQGVFHIDFLTRRAAPFCLYSFASASSS